MTTGRYSAKQPAMTALIAIFSTVAGAHFGGIEPITSCGSRLVPSSILSTRSGVGGTMGKPSLNFSRQNQSLTASKLSSTSIMLDVKLLILAHCLRSKELGGFNPLRPRRGGELKRGQRLTHSQITCLTSS